MARARTIRRSGPAAAVRAGLRLPHIGTWPLAGIGLAIGLLYGVAGLGMSLGAPLIMVGLGGMTLALSGRALWRVVEPLTRGDGPDTEGPARPEERGHLHELEREKQAVLKAIKEIELDFQMRKIAKEDYREMVERHRARALRLLAQISAGDNYRELIERELRDRLALGAGTAAGSATAQAPEETKAPEAAAAPDTTAPPAPTSSSDLTARACGFCGTNNDGDAQFCKRCGNKLIP